jgi:hypothetical protein
MEITIDQLRSRYESLETEDLLVLLAQGDLTQEAELALQAELRARGYADRNSALHAGAAANAANAEALELEAAEQRTARAKFRVGRMLLLLLIPACMPILAPFIWHSPADRACQRAGYWYATEVGLTQIRCFSWKSHWSF